MSRHFQWKWRLFRFSGQRFLSVAHTRAAGGATGGGCGAGEQNNPAQGSAGEGAERREHNAYERTGNPGRGGGCAGGAVRLRRADVCAAGGIGGGDDARLRDGAGQGVQRRGAEQPRRHPGNPQEAGLSRDRRGSGDAGLAHPVRCGGARLGVGTRISGIVGGDRLADHQRAAVDSGERGGDRRTGARVSAQAARAAAGQHGGEGRHGGGVKWRSGSAAGAGARRLCAARRRRASSCTTRRPHRVRRRTSTAGTSRTAGAGSATTTSCRRTGRLPAGGRSGQSARTLRAATA